MVLCVLAGPSSFMLCAGVAGLQERGERREERGERREKRGERREERGERRECEAPRTKYVNQGDDGFMRRER